MSFRPDSILAPEKTRGQENVVAKTISEVLDAYPRVNELGAEFKEDLDNLTNKLSRIREGEHREPESIAVSYETYNRFIYLKDSAGKPKDNKISIGEIVAGLDWGINFYFDPNDFPNHDAQKIFDIYIKSITRNHVLALLNKHIIEKEVSVNERKDLEKKKAYEFQKKDSEKSIQNIGDGKLAEKLVQSFLSRIALDHPGLDFELIKTNAYEDVDLKIDFIIRVKDRARGVVLDSKIQFTTTDDARKLELKERQKERVQDIVIIKMEKLNARGTYLNWKKNKTDLDTPDKFLNQQIKRELLNLILKDLVPNEVLEKKLKGDII